MQAKTILTQKVSTMNKEEHDGAGENEPLESKGYLHYLRKLREKSFMQATIWTAALLVGCAAVLFARLISASQSFFFTLFHGHSYLMTAATPLLFVAATLIVQKFGPEARGSGIPQVLEAIDRAHGDDKHEPPWHSPLVSLRTAVVKVISSCVGIIAGASIGREGPTVQISASVFAFFGRVTRKVLPQVDFQIFLTAGAAAGVAAAFNAPLAGIAFALEEVTEGAFGRFREMVMLAVIISGIAAMAIAGNYLYFGHPAVMLTPTLLVPETLIFGVVGGIMGGAFARLLAFPEVFGLPPQPWKRALYCGFVCAAIGLLTDGASAGSGYEVTRSFLESSSIEQWPAGLGIAKFATTVLSYLSGIAGGIFSPCLSIGAGFGFTVAKLLHLQNFKVCGLLGMVGFFSGAIQAPLTAVIIIMEMTDEHTLIIPFLLAAFLSRRIGKIFMPVPLYRFLASKNRKG
ncbi:chloride channel protein [Geomonas nitrogeniifigens]|uniref:chloride channel protein n=1 Tax=Geomonas diazotrophica TaxID=2843197 RepID=UPI001C2CA88B|nr:chloride channel protein [Geomonas nitrogeniifigens]QXE87816.1 chloride channel protein [Geomonas nitrogeniifigens]